MMDIDSRTVTDRINAHLHRLCVEIGPRPGGSAANRAAAEYIRGVFEQACGLEVEMQEFACPAWEELETRLEANGRSLAAVANTFSPPCDVTAPAVAVGTMAELEASDLSGRVGILYGDLAAATLSPKSWFLISEREQQMIGLLEAKAPLALLTVQQNAGDLERLIEDYEFLIPSATVPDRDGLALMGELQRTAQPIVHLRIDSRQEAGRTWNVIGRKAGARRGRTVLCAHYDTKFDTPGALDNGGGVATMLALAEQLSRMDGGLGLECIAFSNEERMPEGTGVYMGEHEAGLGEIVALMNFDGAGHALDVNTVTMMGNSEAFREMVDGLKQAYPGLLWIDPWPDSNHSAFAWRGVPCLAFTSRAARHLLHLRDDTVAWVNTARLAKLVEFGAGVVAALGEREAGWTRGPAGEG